MQLYTQYLCSYRRCKALIWGIQRYTGFLPLESLHASKRDRKQADTLRVRRHTGWPVITYHEYLPELRYWGERNGTDRLFYREMGVSKAERERALKVF